MSSEVPTDTNESKSGIAIRLMRCAVLALLVSPTVAIHYYLLNPPEPEKFDEIGARVTFLTGMQLVHDKNREIEVDLGYFDTSVVRPEINKVLRVRFQLAALIPEWERRRFERFQKANLQRFRDRVIGKLTETEAVNLAEPLLAELRSELVMLANDMTEQGMFRSMIFSKYSVQQQ